MDGGGINNLKMGKGGLKPLGARDDNLAIFKLYDNDATRLPRSDWV